MKYAIEITSPGSWNFAMVAETRIDNRSVMDIAWAHDPTEGELEAVCEGIAAFLEQQFGGKPIILKTERMDDPLERQLATRRFFGGGQG